MIIWIHDKTNQRMTVLDKQVNHLPRKNEKIFLQGVLYRVVEVTHDFSEDGIIIEVEEEKR